MMTKVLAAIVAPPHLAVSGAARAAERLSADIAKTCDITVASMLEADAVAEATFRRVRARVWLPPVVPWGRLSNKYKTLFYRSDLPEIVRRERYDLVHLHNPLPALELERIARACLAAGVPYVISTHGFNEIANGVRVYGFGGGKALLWRRLAMSPLARVVKRAAGVFALSQADIDIVRELGFSGRELTIVPNGVDAPPQRDPRDDANCLGRLGVSSREDGTITLAFLANHTPNKGLPILLEAFSRLSVACRLIVGGETRPEIDYESARRSCGPGKELVITGRLTDEEVGALFRRADLFVFPTLADTFPLVILESMSHGLPVIASNVGGIPFQIDKGCGVLVEPGNAHELAATIDALAREPERRLVMAENAKARVAADFSWGHAAQRAVAGYHRILANNLHRIAAAPSSVAPAAISKNSIG